MDFKALIGGNMSKNLCFSTNGPIAKVKKIAEKNAAKGQGSLATFFGSTSAHSGIKSSQSAFNHYVNSSNAYSKEMLADQLNPEVPRKRSEKNCEKKEVHVSKPKVMAPLEPNAEWSAAKIWVWNVNGIRAVLAKNRIQEFFERTNPLILCL